MRGKNEGRGGVTFVTTTSLEGRGKSDAIG